MDGNRSPGVPAKVRVTLGLLAFSWVAYANINPRSQLCYSVRWQMQIAIPRILRAF